MPEDKPTATKTKKKFYKRPVFWVIAVIVFIALGAAGSGDKANKSLTATNSADKSNTTADATPQQVSETTTATTTPTPTTPAATPAAPTVTVSQKNAVKKAQSYLGISGFSHDGLVDQLVYDQFSTTDATYGADNSGADWNAQAAKKAKSYMDISSFSRGSLIAQLEYDKFTTAQATYGADSVGL